MRPGKRSWTLAFLAAGSRGSKILGDETPQLRKRFVKTLDLREYVVSAPSYHSTPFVPIMARIPTLPIAIISLLALVSAGSSIDWLARLSRAADENQARDHVYRFRNKVSGILVDLKGGSIGRRTSILGRQRAPANMEQLNQSRKLELSQSTAAPGIFKGTCGMCAVGRTWT